MLFTRAIQSTAEGLPGYTFLGVEDSSERAGWIDHSNFARRLKKDDTADSSEKVKSVSEDEESKVSESKDSKEKSKDKDSKSSESKDAKDKDKGNEGLLPVTSEGMAASNK